MKQPAQEVAATTIDSTDTLKIVAAVLPHSWKTSKGCSTMPVSTREGSTEHNFLTLHRHPDLRYPLPTTKDRLLEPSRRYNRLSSHSGIGECSDAFRILSLIAEARSRGELHVITTNPRSPPHHPLQGDELTHQEEVMNEETGEMETMTVTSKVTPYTTLRKVSCCQC